MFNQFLLHCRWYIIIHRVTLIIIIITVKQEITCNFMLAFNMHFKARPTFSYKLQYGNPQFNTKSGSCL